MGKLIFITGGARSGKSSFSEETAKSLNTEVTYIATSIAIDEEMKIRIKKHQKNRPDGWKLIEKYKNIDFIHISNGSTVIIDCLTIMITNLLYEEIGDFSILDSLRSSELALLDRLEEKIMDEISDLISKIDKFDGTVLIVSNEIGMGLVPETLSNRFFRDFLGRANNYIAKRADEVYFCVSGIPVKIKGIF